MIGFNLRSLPRVLERQRLYFSVLICVHLCNLWTATAFAEVQMPSVGITLQKHLNVSDYYSGMYVMLSEDIGKTWKGPREVPELAWREGENGETIAVCDATPGWHPQSRKIIVLGLQLRYSKDGAQLEEKPRSLQTAYAVHDPFTRAWTGWRTFELKDNDSKYYISGPGCSQWLVQDDGNILLPIY